MASTLCAPEAEKQGAFFPKRVSENALSPLTPSSSLQEGAGMKP